MTSMLAQQVESIYLHKGTNVKYRVLHVAHMHSNNESVIVYQNKEGGKIWVRPYAEFNEKFERAPS